MPGDTTFPTQTAPHPIAPFWKALLAKRGLSEDTIAHFAITPRDEEHHRKYNEYVLAIEEMLERTDTEWGPWTIVEATNRRWARIKIFQTIIRRLEEALVSRGFELPEIQSVPEPDEDEAGSELADEEQDSEGLEAELLAEAKAQAGEE